MLDALKQFYTALSAETPLYYKKAPEGTALPYATYRLGQSNKVTTREPIPVIVDLWDNNPDETAMIELWDTIRTKFKQFPVTDVGYPAIVYYNGVIDVEEPEQTIKHKQLNFTYAIYR